MLGSIMFSQDVAVRMRQSREHMFPLRSPAKLPQKFPRCDSVVNTPYFPNIATVLGWKLFT